VTIPNDVTRVSIIGTGPASEVFDTSFWLVGDAPLNAVGANLIATAVRDAWQANAAASWKSWLSPLQRYTEVRVYGYRTGGPNASAIGTAAIVGGDGTGAFRNPVQTCVVAGLRTLFAGRRARGRMYLPATGRQLAPDALWTLAEVTALANATGAFFSALNANAAAWTVGIVSQVGAGSVQAVTSVVVDNKPDIQRRRANKFASTAQFTAAVAV
jgi:hypothetical protein